MGQLRDDAVDVAAPMPLDAAVRYIVARVKAVTGIETISVTAADGRVSAADVHATMCLPPFDNSAVDGWAVDSADLAQDRDTRLAVRGRVVAGGSAEGVSVRHGAVRVLTGAPIPGDADTVFMQEDVEQQGDSVVLPSGLARGANLRVAGEDVAVGDVVVAAGQRLRPQDLALLCAVGETRVTVRRPVRAALLSTGDELSEPGRPLPSGAIYDANRAMLRAMLRRAGAEVDDLGILRDQPEPLQRKLAEAGRDHDLLLTSGGVSTGDEDHVKAAVESVGELSIWRIGIRPGKPVGVGRIGDALFVGLPGNPVAAFVTFAWIVRPALACLAGGQPTPLVGLPVRLGFAHRKRSGLRDFVRVRIEFADDGMAVARKFHKGGTGILTSLTQSDGLLALAEEWTHVEPGTIAPFYSFATLL